MTVKIKGYILRTKGSLNKDDSLDQSLIEVEYIEDYEENIKYLMQYFSKKSELLGIEKIYKQGSLIRPQFSGHKKKYENPAIGLTLSIGTYDKTRGVFKKCSPLNSSELIEKYNYREVEIVLNESELFNYLAWFVDLSQLYPFAIVRVFKIFYNEKDGELKSFLRGVYKDYKEALEITFEHLKIPRNPSITKNNIDKYIVLYRCQRCFVSAVITPDVIREMFSKKIVKLIFSNTISYLITESSEIAYYYSTILNYLAYKVNELKGSYILNQYGRPVEAIKIAGLEWNEEDWQIRIAKLSKEIYAKARIIVLRYLGIPDTDSNYSKLFELVDEGRDIFIKNKLGAITVKVLEKLLTEIKELKQAFQIIDKHTKRENIKKSIEKVANIRPINKVGISENRVTRRTLKDFT